MPGAGPTPLGSSATGHVVPAEPSMLRGSLFAAGWGEPGGLRRQELEGEVPRVSWALG